MKKTKNLFPLNLQLFADGGEGGNGGGEPPRTYSQEEYDKLMAEVNKYKTANDKLSSENAEHKRKAKEKLSEDEKKAQEQKEKEEQLLLAQQELLTIKMSKEFMTVGFDEKTINEIVESFNKGDSVVFAKTLSTHIGKLIENVRKEEQIKFQQSSTTPPNGSGKGTSGLDPIVERYINNKKSNNEKSREALFGK